MDMNESIFESFEAYLEGADYPKGKKKIMQAAVDLISTKGYNGDDILSNAKIHIFKLRSMPGLAKPHSSSISRPKMSC